MQSKFKALWTLTVDTWSRNSALVRLLKYPSFKIILKQAEVALEVRWSGWGLFVRKGLSENVTKKVVLKGKWSLIRSSFAWICRKDGCQTRWS